MELSPDGVVATLTPDETLVEVEELLEAGAEPEISEADLEEEPELAEAWPEAEGDEVPEEFVEKTDQAVERTRRSWFRRLVGAFERSQIDDELWEELEEVLVGADCPR